MPRIFLILNSFRKYYEKKTEESWFKNQRRLFPQNFGALSTRAKQNFQNWNHKSRI